MNTIVSCTNREDSKTYAVAGKVLEIAKKHQPSITFMDLCSLPFFKIQQPYKKFDCIQKEINQLNKSKNIILVCPEYNGSYPGIFKYFVDHWSYPETFKDKHFCLVIVGSGMGTGTRALQHLQSILLYRKAWVFPDSVQIHSSLIENGQIKSTEILTRLENQIQNFFQSNPTM